MHNHIVQVVKVNNLNVLEMWVITNQWLTRLRKINKKVCLYPGNIKIELSYKSQWIWIKVLTSKLADLENNLDKDFRK